MKSKENVPRPLSTNAAGSGLTRPTNKQTKIDQRDNPEVYKLFKGMLRVVPSIGP
jgi:hypothetical protein